jgi:hypothetical protein
MRKNEDTGLFIYLVVRGGVMRQVLFIVRSIVKNSSRQFSQKIYFPPSQQQIWKADIAIYPEYL